MGKTQIQTQVQNGEFNLSSVSNVINKIDSKELKQKFMVMYSITRNIINNDYEAIKKYKCYFVNDVHFEIFVNSVVKRRKYLTKIYFVFTKKQIYTIYECVTFVENEIRNKHHYLLGWDRNKIFVNKMGLSFDYINYECIANYVMNGKEIKIINEKEYFHINLGYNYDIIDEWGDVDEIEIEKVGRYRVQGDLVVYASQPENYESSILTNLSFEIVRVAERLIMNRVLAIVSRHGFNAEQIIRRNRDTVVIYGIDKHTYNDIIPYKIIEIIRNELNIDDILSRLTNVNIKTFKGEITKITVYYGGYEFYFRTLNRVIGRVTVNIEWDRIEIFYEMDRNTLREILEEYKDSIYYSILNNIKNNIQNIELNMGNHHIRIENAIPNSFAAIVNNVLNNNNIVLNVVSMYILVTPQSRMRIDHHEHGTVWIKFKDTYSIEFRFTDISYEFRDRVNKYMFKKMLKTA